MSMTELALRGAHALLDMQLAAARGIWELNARSAAALGVPDGSDLMRATQDGARRLFATSAEQILTCTRRAADTVNEMQTQMTRIVERGSIQLADQLRSGFAEIGRHTVEGLHTAREMAQQQAEAAQRMQGGNTNEHAAQSGTREAGNAASEPHAAARKPQDIKSQRAGSAR